MTMLKLFKGFRFVKVSRGKQNQYNFCLHRVNKISEKAK